VGGGPGCLKLRIRPIERSAGHGHVCVHSGAGHYSPLTDFMTLIRWAQIAARFSFKWKLISSAKKQSERIYIWMYVHRGTTMGAAQIEGK